MKTTAAGTITKVTLTALAGVSVCSGEILQQSKFHAIKLCKPAINIKWRLGLKKSVVLELKAGNPTTLCFISCYKYQNDLGYSLLNHPTAETVLILDKFKNYFRNHQIYCTCTIPMLLLDQYLLSFNSEIVYGEWFLWSRCAHRLNNRKSLNAYFGYINNNV